MKNEIDNANFDPDVDYEPQDGMNRVSIESDDYYDELWQEMLGVDVTISNYYKEFEIVSKVINPKQAAAIYYYSSIEAEEDSSPLNRKREILKMMWGRDNLLIYDINDFLEFRTLIENIDPFAFYVFTEVLYKTKLICHQCIENTEPLRVFEEKVEMLEA